MQLHELISITRELLRDTTHPYLWSDEVLVDHLNEGVEDFMRVVGITPRISTISKTLTAGSVEVRLSDVIEVISSTMKGEFFRDREVFKFDSPLSADTTVEFSVRKRPARMVNAGDVPEYIPATYQRALAYYAAWKSLQSDEIEGRNDAMMEYMRSQWRSYTSRFRVEFHKNKLSPAGVVKVNPLFT